MNSVEQCRLQIAQQPQLVDFRNADVLVLESNFRNGDEEVTARGLKPMNEFGRSPRFSSESELSCLLQSLTELEARWKGDSLSQDEKTAMMQNFEVATLLPEDAVVRIQGEV